MLETSQVCNHAHVQKEADSWHEAGEPTEATLVVEAYKAWLSPAAEDKTLTEFSFNSTRKRMTVIERQPDEGKVAFVKGAPEVILERCTHILEGSDERPLLEADSEAFIAAYSQMASNGLRTLALARRTLPENVALDEDAVETGLTLLGVIHGHVWEIGAICGISFT